MSATTPAISLACVRKNSGLCQPQLTHITGLPQPQHLSASAISQADISHTTTLASIPRFPGSRESDQLGTVCRFWEWKQSAHCSALMWSCWDLHVLICSGIKFFFAAVLNTYLWLINIISNMGLILLLGNISPPTRHKFYILETMLFSFELEVAINSNIKGIEESVTNIRNF